MRERLLMAGFTAVVTLTLCSQRFDELKALGRHILVEMYDCNVEILNNHEVIHKEMLRAAEVSGATIVGDVFHKFNPHGVSGAVVIAESHLSIHTWPEYKYAALDLFTCGDTVDPWKGFDHLSKVLEAGRVSQTELKRGLFPGEAGEALPFKPADLSVVKANC
jgi:S-adenosylmethionine decarboxylase